MSNFAIIAGGGKLPILINKFLLKNGHNVFIIGIKNNFNHKKYKFTNFEEVKIGSISKILSILKNLIIVLMSLFVAFKATFSDGSKPTQSILEFLKLLRKVLSWLTHIIVLFKLRK